MCSDVISPDRSTHAALVDLQWWWAQGDNAVLMSQFWLADVDDSRRSDLVTMEGELLQHELALAFRAHGNGVWS